jgi:hypothetical protein
MVIGQNGLLQWSWSKSHQNKFNSTPQQFDFIWHRSGLVTFVILTNTNYNLVDSEWSWEVIMFYNFIKYFMKFSVFKLVVLFLQFWKMNQIFYFYSPSHKTQKNNSWGLLNPQRKVNYNSNQAHFTFENFLVYINISRSFNYLWSIYSLNLHWDCVEVDATKLVFCEWGKRDIEKLSAITKVTQLLSVKLIDKPRSLATVCFTTVS